MNKILLLHRKNLKFFIWLVIDIKDRLKGLQLSQTISFFLLFFISSIVNAQRTEEKAIGHPEKGLIQLDGSPGSKENMNLREEHSRTFTNVDGSFSKQQGVMPLHYLENNLWLSLEDKLRQNGNVFEMKKTDLPISIDGLSGLTTMKLSQSGTMQFGANTSLKFINRNGQVVSEEWMRSQNQFENSENEVILKNAWNHIDRKQTVHYWSVETDYVINQMPALNIPGGFVHFTENVTLPVGWTIKKGKGIETPQGWNGELIILDENGNDKGNFGKLVFYDSSNKKKSSASGSYAFQQNGTNLILTTIVPADWLMAADRVFPVVIDPTVSNTKAQYGNVYHDNSYGCSETLVVNVPAGTISGTTTTYRITAYEDFWDGGWRSEQRSRVGCGANWSAEQSGAGDATGEQSYSITGMTIADQVWGGGNLTFTWQAKSTYSIASGCYTDYQARTNNWVVTVTYTSCTAPTAYTVNGGGTCQPAAVAVGLSGSQTGVNYQLKVGGVNTGSPVAGTGSAISFGNQGAGVYTVEASGSGYCTTLMTGSTTVSLSTFAPGSTSATLNPVCSGTSFTVSIGAITGATYQWQSSTDGSTYTNIAGATSNTRSVSQTANTYYRCNVTYCSNTIASDPLFVSLAACFNYTGSDQTYVAPNVSCVKVYLWGAGGGGGDNTNSAVTRGGGGGYVEGTLSVSSGENLKIITGQAGQYGASARVDTYGGGGKGGGQGRHASGSDYTGSGGGRSAIRRPSNTEVATAGGGGGGGESPSSGNRGGYGGAGGGTTGQDGYNTVTTTGTAGGKGGTPSAGGAAGAGSSGLAPTAGSAYQGGYGGTQNSGTNIREGGGGGGGYFGGGGGAAPGTTGAGGGGGSSYTGGLSSATNTGGNQFNPGNPSHAYNGGTYGAGGTVGAAGQNGRVVVEYAFTKDKGTVTNGGQTLTICNGETVAFTGGGTPEVNIGTLTYTWYIGRELTPGAYGDWQVIGSAASLSAHNPLTTADPDFPTATKFLYIRRTYSACGGQCVPDCASQDNNIWVNVVSPSGNPATFGANAWNVYGYNGSSTTVSSNTYRGYYVQPALGSSNEGVATQNFWSNTNSPSYAGTTINNSNLWNGCAIDVDNHTYVHKRKGFLCGTYTFTMQNWDDETRVLVDGVNVWSCGVWSGNTGAYSNTTGATYSCVGTNTFTVQLDANSEVEIQVFEAVGGSNLGVDIIKTAPTALSGSGTSSRTCGTSGSAYIDFVDLSGKLIASINPNSNNLGNVTVTSYVGSPSTAFACNTSSNPLYQTAYMGRTWVFSSSAYPGTNFPSAVSIRLPFNDAELTAMNTTATTVTTGNPNDNGATLSNTMLTKFTGTTENNNAGDNCSGGTIRSVLQTGNGNLSAYSIANASYIQFNVAQFSEMFLNKSFGGSPLPVTLTAFSAGCSNMEVELDWTTASEQNSQKFVVQRSRDMVDYWTTVSEVEAAGNSTSSINYVTIDNNPLGGISYYRLVQVDNDGVEKIYGPISVSCADKENSMVVFPNPTEGDFTVQISSSEEILNAEIAVSDLTGKVISVQTMNLQEGKNLILYNGLELQKGTYLVSLIGKGKQFVPVKVAVD